MIYKNLKYKETAVKQLLEKANELLEDSNSDNIIFKAPTGAGKTIIMAAFLMQFISERKDHRTFSFIVLLVDAFPIHEKNFILIYFFVGEFLNV